MGGGASNSSVGVHVCVIPFIMENYDNMMKYWCLCSLFIPDRCDCACVMWTYSSSMRDTPE